MTTNDNTVGFVLLALLFVVGALIYFAPLIVAIRRDHPQTSAIGVINLLLGWTLLGWAVAMAMAVWRIRSHRAPTGAIPSYSSVPLRPKPIWQPQTTVSRSDEKVCPRCAETVKSAAKVCRFCGHEFEGEMDARTGDDKIGPALVELDEMSDQLEQLDGDTCGEIPRPVLEELAARLAVIGFALERADGRYALIGTNSTTFAYNDAELGKRIRHLVAEWRRNDERRRQLAAAASHRV